MQKTTFDLIDTTRLKIIRAPARLFKPCSHATQFAGFHAMLECPLGIHVLLFGRDECTSIVDACADAPMSGSNTRRGWQEKRVKARRKSPWPMLKSSKTRLWRLACWRPHRTGSEPHSTLQGAVDLLAEWDLSAPGLGIVRFNGS